RLEKGRVLMTLGSKQEPKREFQSVLDGPRAVPPEVQDAIRCLLVQMDCPECPSSWSGALVGGYTWDSNATLGSSSFIEVAEQELEIDPSNRSDRLAVGTLLLNYQRVLNPCLTWQALAHYHIADNHRVNDNDLEVWSIGTGLQASNGCDMLNGRVSLVAIELMDASYQNQIRNELSYDRIRCPYWNWGVGLDYSLRHHFASPGASGLDRIRGYSVNVDWHCKALVGSCHQIVGAIYYYYDHFPRAGGEPDRYNRFGGDLDYQYQWKPHVVLTGGVSYHHDQYKNYHQTFTSTKRSDRQTEERVSMILTVSDCFFIELKGEHTRNQSNIPTSDYESNRFTIQSTYLFGS
ncbi:MAG: hypothetical protein KDK78_00975, partial [Chlamydiia bacterium]|nr:hypothetical protein [Chlamydiia bacterium]